MQDGQDSGRVVTGEKTIEKISGNRAHRSLGSLPGKKTATFFQLDQRISMMINLEIASQLPLLHGTAGQGHTNAPIQ
jgi:hypothetical protein